jgi:hypothetical protein
MPKAQTFHVVPHDGAWAVSKKAGGSVAVFENKSDAIDEARKRARQNPSRIVIHGKSGQIIQNTTVKSTLTDSAIRDAVRTVNKAKNGDVFGRAGAAKGSKAVHTRKH